MDKSLKYLVGISALIIAGCAAYFSITGLGILFAGASVSVMVMAGSLEYAKLVTATYLKQKWDLIQGFNKWYLTISVVILMAITSAGIFGYLSNAFQQQNIKLEQVQREIDVWNNKIKFTNDQILTLQGQQKDLSTTQNTLLTKGNVNSRLIRSADNRDKQSTKLSNKINILQDSIVAYNGYINDIKNNNIELEREVGGFRFVAEAFGVELNSVVKFFIFLIVLVFDPLAIALVIAFNQLVSNNKSPENNKNETDNKVKEVIEEESRLKLSENDLKKLEEFLMNPPPPNDNLKRAASVYQDKVIEKTLDELDNYFKNTPKEEIDKHVEEINNMFNEGNGEPIKEQPLVENTNNEESLYDENGEPTVAGDIMEDFIQKMNEELIIQNLNDEDWGGLSNEELIGDDELPSINNSVTPTLSDEGVREIFMDENERRFEMVVEETLSTIEPTVEQFLEEAINNIPEVEIEETINEVQEEVLDQDPTTSIEENTSSEQDDEKKN